MILSAKQNNYSANPILIEATRRAIAKRLQSEKHNPLMLAYRVGIEPDQWQQTVLQSPQAQKILLCSRQAGKSTVSSLLALHHALYYKDALCLVLSPSLRQSQELFRKVKDYLGLLTSNTVAVKQESALGLQFDNGSRIIALPGKEATIRGFSGVSLLIVDEASRVPDELYQAIRPMLAVSKGKIVLLSTPFGKRGFFFHEWTEGGDAWERFKITASECPRIDKEWLERERQMIGDWWCKQEYFCEFVETDDQVFSYEDIQSALTSTEKPLFGAGS